MLNIEKYKEKLVDNGMFLSVVNGKPKICGETICSECDFNREKPKKRCVYSLIDWLCSEYVEKPTLTEQEWHFCMAVQTGWIARDKSGLVHVYNKKPEKNETDWGINGDFYRIPYHLSFDFICWTDTEPWALEELLELEVRKDEE